MMTWTAPNRIALALAPTNATLAVVGGVSATGQPLYTVVARATSRNGAPQHQAVAVFGGVQAQSEANAYARLGFLARLGKLQAGKR